MCEAEDVVEHLGAVLALEGDVVDGEHRLHVLVQGHCLIELAQEDGCHGGVPVVAVQDVAGEVVERVGEVLQRLDDRLGEVREALAVVKEAIRIPAAEIPLVVDEEVLHAVVVEALEAAVLVAPAERDVEVAQVLHAVLVLLRDGVVFRNEHDDLGAGCLEGLRQGTRDVAQAAGLDEGCRLGAGKGHVQFVLGGIWH